MLKRVKKRKIAHRIEALGEALKRLRMKRQSDGKTTIIWLIGRIRAEDLEEIKKQIDDGSEQTVFDLGEVTIVDADVIQFLNARELEGTPLVACPPYVREWILRNRGEE